MRFHLAVAGAMLLAVALPSQRTWIVDNLNRPGTHFTDLPAAVAAAMAGDMLLVRTGGPDYSAPRIDKGIAVAAEPWASWFGLHGTLTIEHVPARERCAVKQCRNTSDADPISIQDCSGSVHFEGLVVANPARPILATVNVMRCQQVTMTRCHSSFLSVEDSNVQLTETTINAPAGLGTSGPFPWAASVSRSRVILARASVIVGSPGSIDPLRCTVVTPPGPALRLLNGDVLLAAGGDVVGGVAYHPGCGTLASAPAVFGVGSLTYDPEAPLAVIGHVNGEVQQLPAFVPAQGASVEGAADTLRLSVLTPAGTGVAIFGSLPIAGAPAFRCPWCLGSVGWPGFWVDARSALLFGVGSSDDGDFNVNVALPIGLRGLPLAFQSLVLERGRLVLSTAAVAITTAASGLR